MNLLVTRTKTFSFNIQCLALFFILLCSCETQLIEDVDIADKTIALTFDDGPDAVYTDMILDVLKIKKVKATFFLVGSRMKQYPVVTERIFSEGHCLANHTYTHVKMPGKSLNEILSGISQTEQLIEGVCGRSYKIFRPPWGLISSEQKSSLAKAGYKVVLWDVNSKDFKSKISAKEIIYNVMEGVGDKKVVLFHDSDYLGKASRKNTALALPQIIDLLKGMGYRFVTISEMENIMP